MTTPAEQITEDVRKWSRFHPFVPDGTAGAFCGSRSPYLSKCGRRESEEVHHMSTTAPVFTFNPPTASAMPESEAHATKDDSHPPYSLHRQVIAVGTVRMRRPRVLGTLRANPDGTPTYHRDCKRSRCTEEIQVYRVVNGTHTVPVATFGLDVPATRVVEDAVYYWPDTAIVVETGTSYSARPQQMAFCSWKCLALWSAKQARDTES